MVHDFVKMEKLSIIPQRRMQMFNNFLKIFPIKNEKGTQCLAILSTVQCLEPSFQLLQIISLII